MNIMTLGDFDFTKEICSLQNPDIKNVCAIISCRMNRDIGRRLNTICSKTKKTIKFFEHKRLKKFSYLNNLNWNDIPPLDQYLVEDLAYCQIETMKMYERIKFIKPDYWENRHDHYLKCVRLFNYLLDNNKIDVFVKYSIPHMGYDNVIYHLCKLKGIPVFCVYFQHPYWGYFIEDVKNPISNFKYGKTEDPFKITRLKNMFNEYWDNKNLSYKPVTIPTSGRGNALQNKRQITKRDSLNFYRRRQLNKLNLRIPYIYVPLHYQFEGTTNPLGRMFTDQILMLEILAQTGYRIYVKEHPRISENRDIKYYEKILSLKNTYLLPIEYNNRELIQKSYTTATITGTAIWESILMGRTALQFGDIIYKHAPYVYRVNSLNDVNKALKKIENIKIEKSKIEEFVKGLENYFFPLTHRDIAANFNKILLEDVRFKKESEDLKND